MIYGFARQSRGHVTIHSEVNKGTTVSLFLPRFIGEPQAQEPLNPTLLPFANAGKRC